MGVKYHATMAILGRPSLSLALRVRVGDHMIWAAVDPDGPGTNGWVSADVVRATGLTAFVGVDNNRDGVIQRDVKDATSMARPFRFWTNQDSDIYYYSDVELGGGAIDALGPSPDATTLRIGSNILQNGSTTTTTNDTARLTEIFNRDLEDFAQIGLWYPDLTADLINNIGFELRSTSDPEMSVRLWRSVLRPSWDDGDRFHATEHVSNGEMAQGILAATYNYIVDVQDGYRTLEANSLTAMSLDLFEEEFGAGPGDGNFSIGQLMFEGITAGAGELVMTFWRGSHVVLERSFKLDLHIVGDLYEHHTIAYGQGVAANGTWSDSGIDIDPRSTPVKTNSNFETGQDAASYSGTNDYILFVHGWNMDKPNRELFADTAYKRLYWQGFRGTFGRYSWPTQVSAGPTADPGNFNRSEEIAWHSATGLLNLINSKQSVRQAGGKLSVIAHSMGGIVASEALKLAGNNNIVDATILTQAAVTTEFFGTTTAPTPYYGAFGGDVGGANPRFSQITLATSKLLNFNNEDDYALGAWDVNNRGKPGGPLHLSPPSSLVQTGFLGANYEAWRGPPPVILRVINQAPTILAMPADRYEMLAHGLYTVSDAVGRVAAAFGPFTEQVDLRSSYGFTNSRVDHSGQFNHSLIEMHDYWLRVKDETQF